jgi:RNA polymerase sigma factor (sigma-70 family)
LSETDPDPPPGRTTDEALDRRLIEGLRKSERTAMAEVYDMYGHLAYALATRILGASSDAEDVVQESFLALWRQASRLDPARGVRSYLMSIVHNKAVDLVRRRGRRPELALDEDAPFRADEAGQPEAVVETASERESVRAALSALSDDQRRAVELTYFGGLTINQAADRLGLPAGTVKSRLRLALGHLRQAIERHREGRSS